MQEQDPDASWIAGGEAREERAKRLADLLGRYRARLRTMVDLRLGPQLRRRVDPSDILQEVFLDAARRLEDYLEDPQVPFFFWVRRLTAQKLYDARRHHLGAKGRDARREREPSPMEYGPETSAVVMADRIVGGETSPTESVARAERRSRIQAAIDRLSPLDREILALRYFEGLSSSESARLLRISEATAAKRYVRALRRLKPLLEAPASGDRQP